jgi:hypothetical protein
MLHVKNSADSMTPFARLVEDVRSRVSDRAQEPVEELTAFAGRAFERFTEALLYEVLAARASDAWIRRRFSDGLESAGAALREVLAECKHRHTVSQTLQCKMFEAETMLRRALKARLLGTGPAAGLAAS